MSHANQEHAMTTAKSLTHPDASLRLIEEGAASIELARANTLGPKDATANRERFDVIVIGGGQAGLSVSYHLAQAGVRFVILDAHERIGDAWRKRWDTLRLFTPAKFDGLTGMRFPAPGNSFPTKDEMASYLEQYAARFQLPVRSGVRVDKLYERGARYVVKAGALELEAAQVVVAMASYQRPKLPAFASGLSTRIVQMHSNGYRNLAQLQPGGVLIVGAGNSGAELAMEMVRGGHQTWISGKETGHIPFRPEGFLGRNLLGPFVLRFVFHRLLTVRTMLGRKVRPAILAKGAPLIRVRPKDLAAAGIERVPRVVGVLDGRPLLEDGRALDVANVIWCGGFHPGFDWIDLPIFGDNREVLHQGGLVEGHPGLYFVGLTFLYSMSSSMIHGVSRDAARIVEAIRVRLGTAPSRRAPIAVATIRGAMR
jgi:putative flavoprotein involved in K+ transport